MSAMFNSLNAHNMPIFQPILMILVSKLIVHRALSDQTYLLLGLLSPLRTRVLFALRYIIFVLVLQDNICCRRLYNKCFMKQTEEKTHLLWQQNVRLKRLQNRRASNKYSLINCITTQ